MLPIDLDRPAVTPWELQRVRRLCAEPDDSSTYNDTTLLLFLARCYVDDEPAGYDLHHAAALIWEEKCAELATKSFDISADGQNIQRSQLLAHAEAQRNYHYGKRRVRNLKLSTQREAYLRPTEEEG